VKNTLTLFAMTSIVYIRNTRSAEPKIDLEWDNRQINSNRSYLSPAKNEDPFPRETLDGALLTSAGQNRKSYRQPKTSKSPLYSAHHLQIPDTSTSQHRRTRMHYSTTPCTLITSCPSGKPVHERRDTLM